MISTYYKAVRDIILYGTLYSVLIARTQGADLIQRGGIALRTATAAAAKAAAGALWQPGGRAGPGTLPT
jgi:hypothetical protein